MKYIIGICVIIVTILGIDHYIYIKNIEEKKERFAKQGYASEIYLNCPKNKQLICKELGALWDEEKQTWYLPPWTDTRPFTKKGITRKTSWEENTETNDLSEYEIGEGNSVDGKKEGEWFYYDGDWKENRNLLSEGFYKNNKKIGLWNYYYKNKKIKEKITFKDGKREGKWQGYSHKGTLREEGNYKDDNLEGEWKGYFDNGNIKYKGSYNEGKRHGDFFWYMKMAI